MTLMVFHMWQKFIPSKFLNFFLVPFLIVLLGFEVNVSKNLNNC